MSVIARKITEARTAQFCSLGVRPLDVSTEDPALPGWLGRRITELTAPAPRDTVETCVRSPQHSPSERSPTSQSRLTDLLATRSASDSEQLSPMEWWP